VSYAGAILLIAIGAILRYALNAHVRGIEIDTVGLILMIAGALGFVVALFQDLVWTERWRRRERIAEEAAVRDDRVIDRRGY
jgi:hypothetical protein